MSRGAFGLLVATALTVPAMSAYAQSAADAAVEAAKQYSGITLTYTSEAGLQALDPINFSGPLWESLTGIHIQTVEMPTNEMFTKTLAEHRAGTGAYDVVQVIPAWLPDLVNAGALEQLDSYIDQYNYREELKDIAPAYQSQGTYDGKTYGLPDDGDVFLLYYRTDLFDDQANKDAFKAEFGYDLAPPTTWEQFSQIAGFFTKKMAPDTYGAALIQAAGLIHFLYEERFRVAGGRFFDADTMDATINSDIGVQVLADMVAQQANFPPGSQGWGPVDVLSAWLAGDLAMTVWWPPPGRWSEGYGADQEALSWVPKTTVAGKVGYAPMPGGTPELAAGFALAVSSDSQHKEAAYLFAQWLNSKEISLQRTMLPYSLRDPFRTSQYESAEYAALWPNAKNYLAALKSSAEAGLLDLSISNTSAYEESLTRALTAALAGGDPKEALDQAAEEWNAITDDVGRDLQKEVYAAWASHPNAYPGD